MPTPPSKAAPAALSHRNAVQSISPAGDGRKVIYVVLGCIAAGAALRLALCAVCLGTNDSVTWAQLGDQVGRVGLLQTYRDNPMANHPPLPLLWARLAVWSELKRWVPGSGEPMSLDGWMAVLNGAGRFLTVMKMPAILADLFSIWLAARIWLRRGDTTRAVLAAIVVALSPVAIQVSGYHCNTDNVYAALSLLSAYCIVEHGAFFLAGLALGAAINVKLIPVLLIPAALSQCRNWRQARRLVGGLAIAAVPFAPPLLAAPLELQLHMLAYAPPLCPWGIPYFLLAGSIHPRLHSEATAWLAYYQGLGRYATLIAAAALSCASWFLRRWNAYQLFLLTYCAFLILAPGFGIQYLVVLVPLLSVLNLSRSLLYGIIAGLFLFFSYAGQLYSTGWPLFSWFGTIVEQAHAPAPLFGLLAWWIILEITFQVLWRSNEGKWAAANSSGG